jgi:hypothetical protein
LDIVTPLHSNGPMQKNRISIQQFEAGQIYALAGSSLQIGLVGKTLVHYKHYKDNIKRAPNSLASKVVLKKYLVKKKAVLMSSPVVGSTPVTG